MSYNPVMPSNSSPSLGDHLRAWRQRRRLSQLELALQAEISQKHLSFVESGRSAASRDLVLRLAEELNVPLRQRNAMLLAAGYAPIFGERSLDDVALRPARDAIHMLLKGHEPFPALALDRQWNMIAANGAVPPLLKGVKERKLLELPVNVLRLSLHPAGLAPFIENHWEWRSHLLDRLRHQIDLTADALLSDLLKELMAYPCPLARNEGNDEQHDYGGIAVPLKLRTEHGLLSFLSTTTVFGTPTEVTLSELALESFFPADKATAETLHRLGKGM
jgi:transcriptional regulator with XRE-family HTH domain